ncbi:MAG: hypothetical protein AB1861_19505 [Cyanobacteriota bacterium]
MQKINQNCITYTVEPDMLNLALNSGLPIEKLPYKKVDIVSKEEPPPPQESRTLREEISIPLRYVAKSKYIKRRVTPQVYRGIVKGGLVALSEETRGNVGQIFQIINRETGSYILCKLQIINDYGYFAQVA